jgi:TetR/AcrR family transcriptional regulator
VTRDALVEAATDLFAAEGFDGVRVEQIAHRAGVNKAMINYHFGGKGGLYHTILALTFGEIAARLTDVRERGLGPAQTLREIIEAFAELVTRRPRFPAMLLREVTSGGRHVDPELFLRIVAIFGSVRSVVEEGVRRGRFRPVDPVLTHIGLIGSLVFFFATAPFRERVLAQGGLAIEPPSDAAYIRHIQDMMTRGLASDEATAPRAKKEGNP